MSRRLPAISVLLLIGMGLGGCLRGPLGSTHREAVLADDADWSLITSVDVPPARGPAGCGAQALATVLAHGAGTDDARALSDTLPWHDRGATPIDLVLAARSRGWSAAIHPGDRDLLAAEIAAGHPPLVMLDVGLEVRTLTSTIDLPEVMHWAVVTGITRDGASVALGAPRGRHHIVAAEEFEERWGRADRCTIVLRPPVADNAGTPQSAGSWTSTSTPRARAMAAQASASD